MLIIINGEKNEWCQNKDNLVLKDISYAFKYCFEGGKSHSKTNVEDVWGLHWYRLSLTHAAGRSAGAPGTRPRT